MVTPRIGKPVEVQALWLNALRIGGALEPRWLEALRAGPPLVRGALLERSRPVPLRRGGRRAPAGRGRRHLPPEPDLRRGRPALRRCSRARRPGRWWTPWSSASSPPSACARWPATSPATARATRAASWRARRRYHQGTVWPWLLGPFVEAWVRVRGGTAAAKTEARRLFLDPLLRHLDEAGSRPHLGGRGRRCAPPPGRLPLPGLVGGGGHPARPRRAGPRRQGAQAQRRGTGILALIVDLRYPGRAARRFLRLRLPFWMWVFTSFRAYPLRRATSA